LKGRGQKAQRGKKKPTIEKFSRSEEDVEGQKAATPKISGGVNQFNPLEGGKKKVVDKKDPWAN